MSLSELKEQNRYVDSHAGCLEEWLVRHIEVCRAAAPFGRAGLEVLRPYLFNRMTDDRSLLLAFAHVQSRSGGTPGLDGYTSADYEPNKYAILRSVRDALRDGRYYCGPMKCRRVPKRSGHGTRRIYIPDFIDRIVGRSTAQVLQHVVEPFFDEQSFGYRPGVGRMHALACAEQWMAQGRRVLLLLDLRDAFDTVPIGRLLGIARMWFGETRVLDLIQEIIGSRKRGIPQGGALSPFLLNVYADHFIDAPWRERCPTIPLIRYSDDLAFFCRSVEEARRARAQLAAMLRPTGLHLKSVEDEATIYDLDQGGEAVWLGYGVGWRDGQMTVQIPDVAWQRFGRQVQRRFRISQSAHALNPFIHGWLAQLGPAASEATFPAAFLRMQELLRAAGCVRRPNREAAFRLWQESHARWWRARRAYRATILTEAPEPVHAAEAEEALSL